MGGGGGGGGAGRWAIYSFFNWEGYCFLSFLRERATVKEQVQEVQLKSFQLL